MFTIYKITNLKNRKSYIGQTSKTIKDRLQRHIQTAMKFQLNTYFAKAIRKYGIENFIIEELETNILSQEEANRREIYYIALYNTKDKDKGYNSTIGGEGGNTFLNKNKQEMKIISKKITTALMGEKNGKHTVIYMKDTITDVEIRFGAYADCERFFEDKGYVFKRRIYADYAKRNQEYGIQQRLFGRYIFRFENDAYQRVTDYPKKSRERPYLIYNKETNEAFIGISKMECFEHFNLHVTPSGRCDIKNVDKTKYKLIDLKPYEYTRYLE